MWIIKLYNICNFHIGGGNLAMSGVTAFHFFCDSDLSNNFTLVFYQEMSIEEVAFLVFFWRQKEIKGLSSWSHHSGSIFAFQPKLYLNKVNFSTFSNILRTMLARKDNSRLLIKGLPSEISWNMCQHVLYFTYLDKLMPRLFLNSLNQNNEKIKSTLLDIELFKIM